MLIVLPHPGNAIPAHHLARCPFCEATMIIYQRSDHFYHPGVATDRDCILSGKGFRLDDAARWNRRTA